MEFPTFEERVVDQNNPESAASLLARMDNTKRAYFIDFSSWQQENLDNYIESLLVEMNKRGINDRFPYPIYLVLGKNLLKKEQTFLNVRSVSGLPNYFKKEVIASNSKEIQKMNRLGVYQKALQFVNTNEQQEKIREWKDLDERIYLLKRENNLLSSILNELESIGQEQE